METSLKESSHSYREDNKDNDHETNIEKTEKYDQLQSNLSEMKEENERLKTMISRIMNDYHLLQTRISKIASSEQSGKETNNVTDHQEPHEFVALTLGTTYVEGRKEKLKPLKSKESASTAADESLTLGLHEFVNAKMQYVSSSSLEETSKSHENKEIWPPNKVATLRSEDDESNAQVNESARRARVSIRARSDAPTINDGCQWRKYGQKVSKGNPCPRAYYRCTVAPNCPVRKQVQRCKEDVSVLITTYEGTHNHVLPVSAIAMASTTAAAASMLFSGSIASRQNAAFSFASEIASPSSSFHNLGQNQFYLQNQFISPSSSHPTVTLDLTTPRQSTQSTYNKNLTYPWNLSYWQRHASTLFNSSNLNISNDIIAKAITSDLSFQSVLQTAVSSYVTASSNNGPQATSTSQTFPNSFTFHQGNEHDHDYQKI